MYTAISSIFAFITAFMFLRMHHVHGSDTSLERMVITFGTIIFLIQAGLAYQTFATNKSSTKKLMTFGCVLFSFIFGVLFFLVVDFDRDSIFSTLFH